MVGTTRFELATSPTPRVRSTRLSHVPTYAARRSPADAIKPARQGFPTDLSVHERAVLFQPAAPRAYALTELSVPAPHTPWAARRPRPRRRRSRSSAPPGSPAPRASTAAAGT